ncbi:hypothetical protein [Longimicrobium sp.]|uniref:hypothetical protein n=1 Tax=Longimicrobium sp. TaxID=2029185 RepID=UPI003B3B392B
MTVLSPTTSLDDIHQAGLDALHRELGLVGMVRFVQQFDVGPGSHTAERAQLQDGMTMDDAIALIQKVRAAREQAPKPQPGWSRTTAPDGCDDELRARGMDALRRELGPRAFVLFLRQFIKPSGDYTAERAELIGHLTVDEIWNSIQKPHGRVEECGHSS